MRFSTGIINPMPGDFSDQETGAARAIATDLAHGCHGQAIARLRALQDRLYAAIPEKQRISRGITWVMQRLGDLLVEACGEGEAVRQFALVLDGCLEQEDRLRGVPIFMMGEYGKTHLVEALPFFEWVAAAPDWVVREFAQAGLRALIGLNREAILPWLQGTVQSADPNLRRLVAEALRPVTANNWLNRQPEYSLSVLRLMFREAHPYPRTSVGNNLSDLARRNPELIIAILAELVESGDKNSYWIAYRACRNLVKKEPQRVMDLLGVDEYHYKDRNFYRESAAPSGC
jgi:3-methyladenine DNA glycosylase AlkC